MNRQRKSGSSRKLRRANESEQRKAVKLLKSNPSSPFATREQVNEVVQQLNDNQQQLGKLLNQTNRGVIQAFTIQDGHIHVQRRIFNDMAKDLLRDGCEGTMKVLEDGSIDWTWYFNEYEMMKVAVAFAMWIRKITGDTPAVKDQQQQDDEADFVFGGDYEGAHDSAG